MTGREVRSALTGAVLGTLACALVYGCSANFEWPPTRSPYGGDFIHEYATSWIVWHGDRTRLYDADYSYRVQHDPEIVGFEWRSESLSPTFYPPPYYILIAPLGALPYRSAAHLWAGLMVLCFVGFVVLVTALYPAWRRQLAWALPGAFLFLPLSTNLVISQKGTLWLLIFAAAFALLRRGWPFAAGGSFGMIALKPPLALALGAALLVKRQWRFVAGAALTGATLVGISWVGWPELSRDWLGIMLAPMSQNDPARIQDSPTWLGFSRLLLGGYSSPGVLALTAALDLATLAALAHLLRGPLRPSGSRFALQFAGVVLATPLLSPYLYTYDLSIVLLPLAIVGGELLSGSPQLAGRATSTRAVLAGVFLLYALAPGAAQALPLQLGPIASFGMLLYLSYVAAEPDPAGWSASECAPAG